MDGKRNPKFIGLACGLWLATLSACGLSTYPPTASISEPHEGVLASSVSSLDPRVLDGKTVPWSVALTLAEVSEAAYEDDPAQQRSVLKKIGFESSSMIEQAHLQAVVAFHQDLVVVGFRGTDPDELSDWITDSKFLKDPVGEGMMHRGFHQATAKIDPVVLQAIEAGSARKNAPIWVTGHSLGGALALGFAFQLAEETERELAGVITFGQPRLLDGALAGEINAKLGNKYIRFQNGRDVVPQIPPEWLGFLHAGSKCRTTAKNVTFLPVTHVYRSIEKGNGQGDLDDLTPEEFNDLRTQLREAREKPQPRTTAEVRASRGQSLLPEHSIESYRDAILRFGSAPR